jgi:hypothetical protein
MTHLRCSECGGDLRVKNYREEKKSHIHEVDMNDETKDMDIIME